MLAGGKERLGPWWLLFVADLDTGNLPTLALLAWAGLPPPTTYHTAANWGNGIPSPEQVTDVKIQLTGPAVRVEDQSGQMKLPW